MELNNIIWKGSREKPLLIDAVWNEELNHLPVVILAHGYKGFKDWGAWHLMAKAFSDAGYLFLKFNFSYNGGTPEEPIDFPDLDAFGKNNYSTEVADFKRVIDFVYDSNDLPRNSLDASDITIIGHSRGGGMAVLTAAKDARVNKLITLASVCDLERRQKSGDELAEWKAKGVRYVLNGRTKQQMPHFYQFYEDYVANRNQLDVLKASSLLEKPWLIIHGSEDKAVPFEEADELKRNSTAAVCIRLKGVIMFLVLNILGFPRKCLHILLRWLMLVFNFLKIRTFRFR